MIRKWRWSVVIRITGWVLIGWLAIRGSGTYSPDVGWWLLAGGIVALGYGDYKRGIEELHAESDEKQRRFIDP